uniref:Uncharacterized protein n=1 Tax=viral metagenome TaxID=1070528 RepID=A0A6M3M9V9_9ZZZZ
MSKHIWSKFKALIKVLSYDEKISYLRDLEAELMVAKTRKYIEHDTSNIHMINKKIRYIKSNLGEKKL